MMKNKLIFLSMLAVGSQAFTSEHKAIQYLFPNAVIQVLKNTTSAHKLIKETDPATLLLAYVAVTQNFKNINEFAVSVIIMQDSQNSKIFSIMIMYPEDTLSYITAS